MEYVTVRGEDVPAIGLGTWRLTGEACYDAVTEALDLGYRHLDTAAKYGNEREVGRAIADSDVAREEVFLTTKVWGMDAGRGDVVPAAQECVDRLGVDYVDLLLLHWPNPLVDVGESVRGLADARRAGLTRHVGVSNFGLSDLRRAQAATDVPIFTDQVQFHPYHRQTDLLGYCQREGIMLTAYSPLAHGGALSDDVLAEVGRGHGKTAAQVALRWAIQHDMVAAIPKATSREHLAANLDVFDFSLSAAEMQRVSRPSLLRTGTAWVRGRVG